MGVWGRGLFQNDDDADIAADLCTLFGFPLCAPFSSSAATLLEPFDRAATAAKLNQDDLLGRKFAKILQPSFTPLTSYHKRERIAIVLGMLSMQTGAIIGQQHLQALRVLRRTLPNIEQQVQLVAALDGYANDGTTVWVSGSKTQMEKQETELATDREENKSDEDEFWFSGLGHSGDKCPTADMLSTSCLSCGCEEEERELIPCSRCKIARFCGKICQKSEWVGHKSVCVPRERVRSHPVAADIIAGYGILQRDEVPATQIMGTLETARTLSRSSQKKMEVIKNCIDAWSTTGSDTCLRRSSPDF
ncbi:hypothetical protein F5Y18DRAFT_395664 [Xylariaceae sp. FL1019]|nr:hypothetical protein F5Y18DRAFT_395664 [Xylariaceae sp. FL1019]